MVEAPPTCHVVGYSGDIITALQHKDQPVYGVQFHPEVQLTVNGVAMLRNFLYNVSVHQPRFIQGGGDFWFQVICAPSPSSPNKLAPITPCAPLDKFLMRPPLCLCGGVIHFGCTFLYRLQGAKVVTL